MKNVKKALFLAVISLMASCSKDNDDNISGQKNENATEQNETATLALEFEKMYQNEEFKLDTEYQTAEGQTIKFSRFSYIISDISLVKEDNSELKYNHTDPNKGAFLMVNHQTTNEDKADLGKIAVGTYTKLKFRVGISNEAHSLGEDKQKEFFDKAANNAMTWAWASGYKHTNFEGLAKWEEGGVATETSFKAHIGSVPTQGKDHSIEVTVDFPKNLVLKKDTDREIHLKVDVYALFSGEKKVKLTTDNAIMHKAGEQTVEDLKENIKKSMFKVEHFH